MYRPDQIGLNHSVQTQIKLDQDGQTISDWTGPKYLDLYQTRPGCTDHIRPDQTNMARPIWDWSKMYRPDQFGPDHSVQPQIKQDQDVQTRLDQTRPKYTAYNKTRPRYTDQSRPDRTKVYRPK